MAQVARRRLRARKGFTLIEITLAVLVVAGGLMAVATYFRNAVSLIDPKGNTGGVRRYLMAEQILRAEAEGLRVLQDVPADAGACRLVAPPDDSGFVLGVTQRRETPTEANAELLYMDLSVTHQSQTVATLTISTLRRKPASLDEKIGL
ncbi:MAG: prepilin-type N-terminal cleavage/methylation domain-containing protein [Candidatus Sericytochromatia bacterium]|nr:prepilin-type N-terminal cleavage/methylation domain-containing protein [Candidatus Sericytochromatia bacterium]